MAGLEPTVRRQELGHHLRVLRKKENYTLEQAAKVINSSASKLSRIETGHRSVTPVEVSALVAVYKASPEQRDELLALADEAAEIGWWQRNQSNYAEQWSTVHTLEAKAETIVSFDLAVIPALLQTGEYTRALMHEMGVMPAKQIEDRMLARLRRHSVLLNREAPKLLAIVDEAVLLRPIGGRDVLRRQLDHVLHESHRHNIEVLVVRNDGPAHSALDGSFTIFRRQGAPPVVFLDNLTSGLFIEDHAEVELYKLAVRNLLKRTLCAEESMSLVAERAKRLDTEETTGWSQPSYAL